MQGREYLFEENEQAKDFKEVEQLNQKEWGEFVFENIFKIYSTSSGIDKNKLINIRGKFPYITRSEKTNGIDFFIGIQNEKYVQDKKMSLQLAWIFKRFFIKVIHFIQVRISNTIK
jgi:hypothetical protein